MDAVAAADAVAVAAASSIVLYCVVDSFLYHLPFLLSNTVLSSPRSAPSPPRLDIAKITKLSSLPACLPACFLSFSLFLAFLAHLPSIAFHL